MVKLERLLDNGNVAGELIKNNILSEINNY
jgi:hypothetical protein